jgi:hypothetical protein
MYWGAATHPSKLHPNICFVNAPVSKGSVHLVPPRDSLSIEISARVFALFPSIWRATESDILKAPGRQAMRI